MRMSDEVAASRVAAREEAGAIAEDIGRVGEEVTELERIT
jgi:hypothetical protein